MKEKHLKTLCIAAGLVVFSIYFSIPAFGQSTNYGNTPSRWGVYPEYGNDCCGQSDYQTPEEIVYGGEFLDRFLKMPKVGDQKSDVWGAEWVLPRDVNNGLEDEEYSYWGGNIVIGDDGENHLFICRWPNDCVINEEKSGHECWSRSDVVHAVSDNPMGPYKVIEEIGKGHNPEIYRKTDGSYIIGAWHSSVFHGPTINGPWTQIDVTYDLIDPEARINHTNRTFAVRDDGSIIMMNKQGLIFINEVGSAPGHWKQLTAGTVYHRKSSVNSKIVKLEDPVIWRDEIQYHSVYHDWNSPMGLYLRSPDGVNWTYMEGKAYQSNNMMNILDIDEEWFTYERPKVRQDKYGRATHMNWAVCDAEDKNDKAFDEYSSKNLIAPMTLQRRYVVLSPTTAINGSTSEIQIKMLAEEGFNPLTDINLSSLKIGAPETVNLGGGGTYKSSEVSGDDLIITFNGSGNGITASNFATKLMGKTNDDKLLFGFSALKDGVPINALRELVISHTLPDKVESRNINFDVAYEVWHERDIVVSIWNKTKERTELTETKKVNISSSTLFEIAGLNTLPEGDSFEWHLHVLPVGGELTEHIGILIKKDFTIDYSKMLGIDNSSTYQELKPYPNPFGRELIINSNIMSPVRVVLYDSNGKLVFTEEYNIGDTISIKPSYSAVPAGFYIMKLSSKESTIKYKILRK